jgi:hypothetical protein
MNTVVIICKYCGTPREVPGYYAKRYTTCGGDECARKRIADRAAAAKAANTGRKHSPEVNKAKGRPGRPKSPEHVAKLVQSRQEHGWFQVPDIGARISAGLKASPNKSARSGPANPMWRGGISATPNGSRATFEYDEWHHAVMTRDGRTCQVCGSTRHVIAHHIKSWHTHPELRADPDNGIALCRKCHMGVESGRIPLPPTHLGS